ncbi:MAG: DUF2029 domain-containing protein [Chloroflexi bacterium]|nr:DUF2029 domain-containing protein [Chloroflexota bacterium]
MAYLDAAASARTTDGARLVLPAAAAAALLAFLATLVLAIAGIVRVATGDGGAGGDFMSFYAAGYIVRHGMTDGLYNGAVQAFVQRAVYPGDLPHATGYPLPLFVAWAFAPLSRLPFTAAYLRWTAINAALLAALAFALDRHLVNVPMLPRRTFIAVFACSIPAVTNIILGQVDFIVFGALFGAYLLLREERESLAGIALAVVLIKPQFLLGVVPMLLLWQQWRTLRTLALAGGALLIVPALLAEPGALAAHARFVAGYQGAGGDLHVNAAAMSNWRGLAASVTGSNAAWAWLPGMAAITAGAFAVAMPRWRLAAHGAVAADQAYALAVMLPLLVSPHLYAHSLVLLFIPLAIALRGYFPPDDATAGDFARQSGALTLMLALYAALFTLWLSTSLGFAPMVLLVAALFAGCAWRWPNPEPQWRLDSLA